MNRRDALKSFAGLVSATGLTAQPVTTQDTQGVELVIFKCESPISNDTAARLRSYWEQAVEGTALEKAKVIVLSGGVEMEFVRTKP